MQIGYLADNFPLIQLLPWARELPRERLEEIESEVRTMTGRDDIVLQYPSRIHELKRVNAVEDLDEPEPPQEVSELD